LGRCSLGAATQFAGLQSGVHRNDRPTSAVLYLGVERGVIATFTAG
ncbi:MAG: hypothetical protein JWR66_3161, partial [Modestobacter sp.]|nr:hypothetical protein [Modestobacter sp.]